MDDQTDKFWGKYGIRLVLVFLVLFGAALVGVFDENGIFPFKFGEHLATALAIAGIIGLLIEFTLQRQIIRNVFRTAVGYLLPEELRAELRWIYGLSIICEKHIQIVQLLEIPNSQLIHVRNTVIRTFRNISDRLEKLPVGLGVDEWFHDDHPSKIISFTYQKEGEDTSEDFALKQTAKTDAGLSIPIMEKTLEGGKRITISFEVQETKHQNDWMFLTFGCPTANPTVTLYAPESFSAGVVFDHRDKKLERTKKGERNWQLDGMMLPHQDIRIRWFKKDQSQKWLAAK